MMKLISQALVVLVSVTGCSAVDTPAASIHKNYVQRAYLGQIGLPVQSDVAIIQAPHEHVIWVNMEDRRSGPYQWLAPSLPLAAMAKEAMQQPVAPAAVPPPSRQEVQISTVNFIFGAWRLNEHAKAKLNALPIEPGSEVEVVGHTDSVGSNKYNQNLSLQRANSVRNHLVVRGVKSGQIAISGKGESDPTASNKTESGRAANRRADIAVKEVQ